MYVKPTHAQMNRNGPEIIMPPPPPRLIFGPRYFHALSSFSGVGNWITASLCYYQASLRVGWLGRYCNQATNMKIGGPGFFHCEMFNDAVSSSYYEGSGRGIIEVLSWHSRVETEEYHKALNQVSHCSRVSRVTATLSCLVIGFHFR
jgi:hypothetical protein